MNKHIGSVVSIACLVALLIGSHKAHAACTKDTDCKGDRICQDGRCTTLPPVVPTVASRASAAPVIYIPQVPQPVQAPQFTYAQPGAQHAPMIMQPGAVAQAQAQMQAGAAGVAASYTPEPVGVSAPTTEAPLTWHRGYAELSTPMNFQGWLGLYGGDGQMTSGFGAGVRVAGYYAGARVHVGGFLSYQTMDYTLEGYGSDEASNLAAGVALKFGGSVGQRLWMGLALDAGFNALLKGDVFIYNHVGVHLYTGYCLDALLVGSGPFKMTLTTRLGMDLEPFMGSPSDNVDMWQVRLGLTVGVTFGGGSRS